MLNARLAIGAALAGAFILGAAAISLSSASSDEKAPKGGAGFSTAQEDEIREIVRTYLMDNPEVIIEAVGAYSERERVAAAETARRVARDSLDELLDPDTAFIHGKDPAKARVAVIELFDYHCGFCKRAVGLVREMTEDDEAVKVVFRELPILRPESETAAELALAARDQGKFLDLHFAMMESTGTLTKERVLEIAEEQGLDAAKLEAAAERPEIAAAITANRELAREMGVGGTPAFIIASLEGDYLEIIEGFRAEDVLEKIEEAKKASS